MGMNRSGTCGFIFQLADLDDPEMFRFGTFQPIFFSLTTALEAPLYKKMPEELKLDEDIREDGSYKVRAVRRDPEDEDYVEGGYFWEFGHKYESESEDDFTQQIRRSSKNNRNKKVIKRAKWLREAAVKARVQPVDSDNVQQLKKLLNKVEKGFGTRFFTSAENPEYLPYGVLEKHWNGFVVNLTTNTTTCRFCGTVSNPLLRQHCEDIFQPLKRHMLRHFKHVRYVRPPKN